MTKLPAYFLHNRKARSLPTRDIGRGLEVQHSTWNIVKAAKELGLGLHIGRGYPRHTNDGPVPDGPDVVWLTVDEYVAAVKQARLRRRPSREPAGSPPVNVRPSDLIPLADAAPLVNRCASSLRAWMRAGRLRKWREDPADTGSRVLVSRAELLALAPNASEAESSAHDHVTKAPAMLTAEDVRAIVREEVSAAVLRVLTAAFNEPMGAPVPA